MGTRDTKTDKPSPLTETPTLAERLRDLATALLHDDTISPDLRRHADWVHRAAVCLEMVRDHDDILEEANTAANIAGYEAPEVQIILMAAGEHWESVQRLAKEGGAEKLPAGLMLARHFPRPF